MIRGSKIGAFGVGFVLVASVAQRGDAQTCAGELGCGDATGTYSTAAGHSYAMGSGSTATGYGSYAVDSYSVAMGYLCDADGNSAIAMGYQSYAAANYATAIGYSSLADGSYSTAIGGRNVWARGAAATAIGRDTYAEGDRSTAMGYNTEAKGSTSTAMGGNTYAYGDYSTAMGYQTDANAFGCLAIGRYNVGYYDSLTAWDEDDPVFEVGVGTSSEARANAFTVLKNGNVGVSTALPDVPLHVTGGVDASLTDGSGYLVLGSQEGKNVVIDNNEIVARDDGSASKLYLNASLGDVEAGGRLKVRSIPSNGSSNYLCADTASGGGWLERCTSSRRYKTDIVDLASGLAEVQRLRSVEFTSRASGERDFGFIAEEVAQVHPIFATYDAQGRPDGVRYPQMTAVLARAVQQLSAQNTELLLRADEQASQLSAQATRLNEQEAELAAQASQIAQLQAALARQEVIVQALAEKASLAQ